jgi:phage terminase large subunit
MINPSDVVNVTQDQAANVVRAFQADPNLFLCEALGITKTWEGQQHIMKALASEGKVAVHSCHSAGKDYIGAALMHWFLYNFIPSIVIATGPTNRQVDDVVWGEFSEKFHAAKIPLGGRIISKYLEVDEKMRWYATGFTTKDSHNTPGRFQGYHQKNIFILLTEAQAIERSIWDQVETLTSSGNAKVLALGNPVLSYGPFFEACQPKSGWKVIRLDAEDIPNIKEGREVIPGLCSKTWVDMMAKKYGTESPTYLSKVRGFFPKTSTDTFIEPQWVEWANTKLMDAIPEDGPEVVGLDPASYGSNKTIIIRRRGMKVVEIMKYERKSTMETVGVVVKTLQEGAQTVFLDVTGVGTGIYDRLVELGFGQRVVAINFGGKPKETGWYPAGVRTPKDKYDDIATQMYDRLKGYLETRKMAFPYDEDLSIQLVNRKMKVQSSGRMKLESKKEFAARGYDSPDEADALALCFCEVDEGENVSPEPIMEVQEDKTLDAIFS